ncbi:MAG: bacteriophage Gp15 family protein [Lactobacillus sp.]|nr:bacteriophage Gp15 family protein [Lactobacillus sp.]MDN6663140.1 bacteriophage Gp15 family protein [Tetragenococcus koreensis]
MFSLTEDLEQTANIDGKEYDVDLSFNTVIDFYALLEDEDLESYEKVALAFELFLPQLDSSEFTMAQQQETVNGIVDYIQEAPYGNADDGIEEQETSQKPKKNFSYSQDAGAIYSSFMQDYGIDLLKEKGQMHYLTFKALLDGLSDKTYFQRIVGLREESLAGKQDEALNKLVEAQNYFALEENRTEEHLSDQMGDMFSMLKAQAENE